MVPIFLTGPQPIQQVDQSPLGYWASLSGAGTGVSQGGSLLPRGTVISPRLPFQQAPRLQPPPTRAQLTPVLPQLGTFLISLCLLSPTPPKLDSKKMRPSVCEEAVVEEEGIWGFFFLVISFFYTLGVTIREKGDLFSG